jgi:hypothetical protein
MWAAPTCHERNAKIATELPKVVRVLVANETVQTDHQGNVGSADRGLKATGGWVRAAGWQPDDIRKAECGLDPSHVLKTRVTANEHNRGVLEDLSNQWDMGHLLDSKPSRDRRAGRTIYGDSLRRPGGCGADFRAKVA